MSNAAARSGKSGAVTAIGLATLVVGSGYSILGVCLLFAGTDMAARLGQDPAGGLGPLLQILAGFLTVLGGVFVAQGVPGMLGGWGVLLRRSWGRILALLLAALAVLWGLVFLVISQGDAILIALGAVQILYGILAFVVLLGGVFSANR
jgi:hypothetical protein